MDLTQKLNAYTPQNPTEMQHKTTMLQFLNDHHNCFERACVSGHFTASSWLLNPDHTKALLLHHKKLNMWMQLGGHCDGDEDVLNVAIKEAQEESGIDDIKPLSPDIFDIDIHPIPERPGEPAHIHLDIRFLLESKTENFIQNEESLALKWYHIDDQNFPQTVMRMVEKWRDLMKNNALQSLAS